MSISQIPLVILLDIDGTLIGDITPQVILYELSNKLKGIIRFQNINKNIQEKLINGVVRPQFKHFFTDLSSYGVEFFIYTASEKKWAEYIVKQIETVYNIKFNRPLFTRNNCEIINKEYKKNIAKVKPAIYKCLKKKYTSLKIEDLKNKIMAIDNNKVYNIYESKHLLHCSTYNYFLPENIMINIPKHIFDKHTSLINNVIMSYYSGFKYTTNYYKFEKQFYTKYIEDLSTALRMGQNDPDFLFKTIRNFILNKKIKTFNEYVVQYLNNKIDHSNK